MTKERKRGKTDRSERKAVVLADLVNAFYSNALLAIEDVLGKLTGNPKDLASPTHVGLAGQYGQLA